jgi:hypothetical protein
MRIATSAPVIFPGTKLALDAGAYELSAALQTQFLPVIWRLFKSDQ